jgi:hypothetical protein
MQHARLDPLFARSRPPSRSSGGAPLAPGRREVVERLEATADTPMVEKWVAASGPPPLLPRQ